MKDSVKSVTVLFTICLIVSALLAAVYFVTGPIIEASEKAKSDAALLVVMPKGSGFKKIDDLSGYSLPETVTDVYSEENGGYVFKLRVTFSAEFHHMCGVAQARNHRRYLYFKLRNTRRGEGIRRLLHRSRYRDCGKCRCRFRLDSQVDNERV